MRKLGMNLILFAAFIPAYANPVDCDVENDSCIWSVQGFVWISDNELNSTDGRNNIMHMKERNFLDGLCSWLKKESNVPAKVNNALTEFKSTGQLSVLTAGFDICPGYKCLSFKYQMKDFKRECIAIGVHSYAERSWSVVWMSRSQHQIQGWSEINVTLNVDKSSKISISFLHGNCSNVTYYISSISLKEKSCTESTTTYRTSPSTVFPMNPSAATFVNTSSHYGNDNNIIGMESIIVVVVVVPVVAAVVVSVLLVAICRRRKQFNSAANMPMNNTGSYENLNVVYSQENYEQIIRVTPGRDNTMMDRVYNNEEPEYDQI